MTTKRLLWLIAGLAVSAAAVGYFVHGMQGQWREMGAAFARANHLWLVPSVGLLAASYALRIARWRLFLSGRPEVSARHLTNATLIGFMSSCILPLRPGEIIRPCVLHRQSGIPFGEALGTAGLERLFDMLGTCFLVLLAWTGLWLSARTASGNGSSALLETAGRVARHGWLFAGATAAVLAVLAALAFFPGAMLRAAGAALRPLPGAWRERPLAFAESVAKALGFVKSPPRVALALTLSLAQWLMFPLSTWCLARGFNLGLGFAGALVVQALITVAVAAPQAPGFFGPFQVAAATGVGLFGAAGGDAGAFAMMVWAANVVPITLVGLAVLWREELSLGALTREARAEGDRMK